MNIDFLFLGSKYEQSWTKTDLGTHQIVGYIFNLVVLAPKELALLMAIAGNI